MFDEAFTYAPEVGARETRSGVRRHDVGSWDGLLVTIGWWSEEVLEKSIHRDEEPARDMREGHNMLEAVDRVQEPAKDMRGGHPMPESVSNQLAR